METDRRRYNNVDILKFVAIFGVIIIHCWGIKIKFWETEKLVDYAYYFFRTFLATSVPIFFICNGFLLFGKELDWKKHVLKTVKTVILTYFWGVLTIVFVMLIKGIRISVGEIINMFREWQQGWINHLWFMGALTRIYLIFPILKLASEKKKEALLYITFLIFVFTTINKGLDIVQLFEADNQWLKSLKIFDPFQDSYDWTYVYFCLGGVCSLYRERIEGYFNKHRKWCNVLSISAIIANCILLFVCGVFISQSTSKHWDVVWEGYNMIFTMFSVGAIYILSLNYREMKNKIFAYAVRVVGSNTLGIYFIHTLFIHIWSQCVDVYAPLSYIGTIIVCAIVTLIMSVVVTKIIKSIPVVKLLVN